MKTLNYIKIFLLALACYACSSDKDEEVPQAPDKVGISISTSILTRAVTTAFSSGDKMNLYVKTESSVTSADHASGIVATYSDEKWTLHPVVELKEGEKAYLFASYPYVSDNVNPAAVPVTIASQIDYLYSGAPVSVAYSSPDGILTMKHALSMLAFNISKEGYEGVGNLKSISIDGETFYTEGTLNISSGVIDGTKKGNYKLATNKTIAASGWKEQLPQMFCIPFNSDGKDVTVTMSIDEKNYTVALPKINVETGMKYVFRLAITNNGLTIFADQTEKISLNKDDDNMMLDEYSILKIAYVGADVEVPELTGEKNDGTVYWGDSNKEIYCFPLTHIYSDKGEHTITIETWGTTGMKINDLGNVEFIDLSAF